MTTSKSTKIEELTRREYKNHKKEIRPKTLNKINMTTKTPKQIKTRNNERKKKKKKII